MYMCHYDDVDVSCLQNKIRTLQAWAVSTTITARYYVARDSLYLWLCFV